MRISYRTSLAIAVLALGVAASWAPSMAEGGRKFVTALSGAAEVPGPGDPDATGTATVVVNVGQATVQFDLFVANIDRATAAHIHTGNSSVAGPVVVTLAPPDSAGRSSGIVAVDKKLAQDILRNPDQYYVNVHNAAYPTGALRGQLGR